MKAYKYLKRETKQMNADQNMQGIRFKKVKKIFILLPDQHLVSFFLSQA